MRVHLRPRHIGSKLVLAAALSILICAAMSAATPQTPAAQAPQTPAAQAPQTPAAQTPQTPRAMAPFDLTGYWVSVVTEDWRWRMVTPPKGDFASIPLNVEARKVADGWDPAKIAEPCMAFGAAAIMRMPGRLNISWQDDSALKIETDAGTQTRVLRFGESQPGSERTWQGHSVASWELPPAPGRGGGGGGGGGGGRGGAAPPAPQANQPRRGALKVVTTNLRPGWLRTNGVPYSEKTVVTEFFDRFTAYGTDWFVVTTIVDDPRYLTQPFITTSHFKEEPDGSKFSPTPCNIPPPLK